MTALVERLWELGPTMVGGTPHAQELGMKFVAVDKGRATLSLRIDYQRAATPGKTIISEAVCYKTTRHVAFVRAIAHDGNEEDPIATAQSCFMVTGKQYSVEESYDTEAGSSS